MKAPKIKPLSLKLAAYTELHISKNFMTNGHFILRASLFHVLALKEKITVPRLYKVNGRGTLHGTCGSDLLYNNSKAERVFEIANADDYAPVHGIMTGGNTVLLSALEGVATYISAQYLPLYERLAAIPGGEWQINATAMRALRFIKDGNAEALLMPVRAGK